jgi:hypothetical protein
MGNKYNINFTKAALMALPIPNKGFATYYDVKEKGPNLYVTPTGHKSFTFRRYMNGKQKRIILGHFPDMTVKLARKEAQ